MTARGVNYNHLWLQDVPEPFAYRWAGERFSKAPTTFTAWWTRMEFVWRDIGDAISWSRRNIERGAEQL